MPDSRPEWMLEAPSNDALDATMVAEIEQFMATSQRPDLKFAPGSFDAGGAAQWRSEEAPIPQSQFTPVPMDTPGGAGAPPPIVGDTAPSGPVAPSLTGPDGRPLPPPAPGVEPVVPDVPETFRVSLPTGDTFDLDQGQANYLLSLNAWVQGLPPEVRQQMAAVESGDSVAIPRSDYEAYLASKNTPPVTPQPTLAPPVQRPQGYDPAMVDGSIAEYIARLEANQAAVGAGQQGQAAIGTPSPGTPPLPAPATTEPTMTPAQMEARISQAATRQVALNAGIESGLQAVAAKYGLTPEQMDQARSVAPGLNIIPQIAARHRQVNPVTGETITEGNFTEVFTEVFDTVMRLDPNLSKVRDNYIFNQQTAEHQETIKNVQGKKAAAATLATAPSAAVPSPTVDMSKMTPGQRQAFINEQMRQELAVVFSGGTIEG